MRSRMARPTAPELDMRLEMNCDCSEEDVPSHAVTRFCGKDRGAESEDWLSASVLKQDLAVAAHAC